MAIVVGSEGQQLVSEHDVGKPVVPAADSGQHCDRCPRAEQCLPLGLNTLELQALDEVMRISRVIPESRTLFAAGTHFEAIYAVRAGAFKTVAVDCEGYERVLGFYLPGDLLGLDGIYTGLHQCDAVAIGTAGVCVFPYSALTRLANRIPRLTERLLQLLSKDVVGSLTNRDDYRAEERLAGFLLRLSRRLEPRGRMQSEMRLPMSRSDLANHLGLAGATLSRTLNRLQQEGLIAVNGRVIRLRDSAVLHRLGRRIIGPEWPD